MKEGSISLRTMSLTCSQPISHRVTFGMSDVTVSRGKDVFHRVAGMLARSRANSNIRQRSCNCCPCTHPSSMHLSLRPWATALHTSARLARPSATRSYAQCRVKSSSSKEQPQQNITGSQSDTDCTNTHDNKRFYDYYLKKFPLKSRPVHFATWATVLVPSSRTSAEILEVLQTPSTQFEDVTKAL